MRLTGIFWMILTNVFTATVSYLLLINIYTSDDAILAPCCSCDEEEIVPLDRSVSIDVDQPNAIENCTSNSSHATTGNNDVSGSGNIDIPELIEKRGPISCHDSETVNASQSSYNDSLALSNLKTVLAITPTYKRVTQKADLVSLCHTIMHVPNFLWIVIEDSENKTDLVRNVLRRCEVNSVHLNVVTSNMTKKAAQRGVDQRNAGLDWIRAYCKENCQDHCNGVVYFMDDDNKYDLRLFQQMRKTKTVSVFPVGYSGGLKFEGPICKDEKAVAWQSIWKSKERHIPVDMAAFAINVKLFLQNPNVKVGYSKTNRSRAGFMESDLIKSIGSSRDTIECRGVANEVLVWHVRTANPFLCYKNEYPLVEV